MGLAADPVPARGPSLAAGGGGLVCSVTLTRR